MINTNLTSIRWRKSLYYVSEGVIFDIRNSSRPDDKDDCATFLIDFTNADAASREAAIGATVNLTNETQLFGGLPWIEVKFDNSDLDLAVPLQYLIEEGDTFISDNTGQAHPNVYNKDYRNKFTQEVFEYIGSIVNSKNTFDDAVIAQILTGMPAWMTCEAGTEMTKEYVQNYFLKGKAWEASEASIGTEMVTFTGATLKTPMGDAVISGNWDQDEIYKIALAFYAVKSLNGLNLTSEMMETIAALIIENNAAPGEGGKLAALYHIDFDSEGTALVKEVMAKVTDADTWWEYQNEPGPGPEPEVRHVNNIQEFIELGETGYIEDIAIDSDITFVFRIGRWIFIEDNTRAICVYDYNAPVVTNQYNEGDVIKGGIVGKYSTYNGMVEFIPSQNWPVASSIPVIITPLDVNDIKSQDLVGKLVVTNIPNSEKSIIHDRFNTIGTIPEGDLRVTGFVAYPEKGYEIWPRTIDDIQILSTPASWDFIHDEQSWNDAYQPGKPLYKYYQDHPEEDLWNTVENRAVNFNDRWYEGTIDGEEVSCGTQWAADGVQKITIDDVDYYTQIWGYDLSPANCELFENVALTESTDKIFEIATVSFSPDCIHCWEGTINAPGAVLPWCAVDVPTPFTGTIRFIYNEGEPVWPWGETPKEFIKGYGIASIPTELGPQYDASTFDPALLAVDLIPGEIELPTTEG